MRSAFDVAKSGIGVNRRASDTFSGGWSKNELQALRSGQRHVHMARACKRGGYVE